MSDYGEEIISTIDSGFLAIGATESFGNGLTDLYIIKIDQNGNFQWHKTFGGPAIDYGKSIIQTPDSGFIACGYSNSIDLDYDLFLIKIDQNGNLEWKKDMVEIIGILETRLLHLNLIQITFSLLAKPIVTETPMEVDWFLKLIQTVIL